MTRLCRQVTAGLALALGCACMAAGAAQVSILTPAQNDTIHDNSGNMQVAVRVDPPVDPEAGTSIRILLDGKVVATQDSERTFLLHGIDRGQHSVSAVLVDRNGRTLARSAAVAFTMWQASIRNPARRRN